MVIKQSFGETGFNAFGYANPPKIESIKEIGDIPFPLDQDATQY